MEPITIAKISVGRALTEVGAYAGVSAFALTMTTAEVGIAVTVVGGVIGIVVWLVRLEGRINLQGAVLERVDKRTERLAEHMGVVE
jgi:hypothetical protein